MGFIRKKRATRPRVWQLFAILVIGCVVTLRIAPPGAEGMGMGMPLGVGMGGFNLECGPPECTCSSRIMEVVVNCTRVKDAAGGRTRWDWSLPHNATRFYLERSLLSSVPWETLPPLAVTQLHLRHTSISKVESLKMASSVISYRSLTTLDLQWNNFHSVTSSLLKMFPLLGVLNMASNRILRIERGCFRLTPKLTHLDLSNNNFGPELNHPGVFSGLHNLTDLKLINCSIRSLHRSIFRGLTSLENVHLGLNQLSAVPVRALVPASDLMLLNLWRNKIRYVDETLSQLRSLQYLFIHGNGLEDIHPRALDGLDRLVQISLNDNNLRTLPVGLQPALLHIRGEVNLNNITWHCDCRLLWVARFVQTQTAKVEGPSFARCSWPRHLAMTSLRHVTAESLRCPVLAGCEEGDMASVQCKWCPPFQKPTSDTRCQCMEGYEPADGDAYAKNSACQPCPVGWYKAEVGTDACVSCPPNSTTLTEGSSFCVCKDGFMQTATHVCDPEKAVDNVAEGGHGWKQQLTTSPGMKGAKSKLTTAKTPFVQSGLMVAVGVGLVVVVFVVLVMGLSLVCARHMPCRKPDDFFVDTTDVTHHVLGVNIDHGIITLAPCEMRLHIRRVRVGRLLGRGAFGQVHEGVIFCTQNNSKRTLPVAVKRLKDRALEEEGKVLHEELEQMILVGSHPNIIGLLGSCVHEGNLHIIMELAEQGDLLTYLRNRKLWHEQYVSVAKDGTLSMQKAPQVTDHAELMMFAWHIARGMSHLEELKCIHRDLAARNCLLAAGPVAKLSDFGLSRDVYENGYYFRRSKGRIPYKWLSPEAMLWGQYSSKSDVWSYGVLLWEIATLGGTPYSGIPPERIGEMHRARYRLPQPPRCPDNFYRVIRCCWHEDPRKRPTFRQLCDVIDHFVQAAADTKYLDLQPQSEKISPDEASSADDPGDKLLVANIRRKLRSPMRHESATSDLSQSVSTCTERETRELDMELEPMLRELCSRWSDVSSAQSQWSEDELTIKQTQDQGQSNYTSGYFSSQSIAT